MPADHPYEDFGASLDDHRPGDYPSETNPPVGQPGDYPPPDDYPVADYPPDEFEPADDPYLHHDFPLVDFAAPEDYLTDDYAPFPDDFAPPPDDYLPPDEFSVDPNDPDGWTADVDALLAEFEAERVATQEVELPGQIPATALVEMRADPAKLARRLRRPLPFPPNPLARRGTAFHAWVQRWFSGTRLIGLDELPGAGGPEAVDGGVDAELTRMQNAFLESPWAHRSPLEVEIPFETSIAGTVIRGRMDAVFAEPGAAGSSSTGRPGPNPVPPTNPRWPCNWRSIVWPGRA